MDRPRGVRVLTVGDGDLSFSLALARAFRGDELFLTATTLLTADELRETYGNAAPILAELSKYERELGGVRNFGGGRPSICHKADSRR